jgi:hypothetical protein
VRGKTRGNKLLFQPPFDGAAGQCGPRRPHIYPGSSSVQNIFSSCYLLVAVAGQRGPGDLFQAIAPSSKSAEPPQPKLLIWPPIMRHRRLIPIRSWRPLLNNCRLILLCGLQQLFCCPDAYGAEPPVNAAMAANLLPWDSLLSKVPHLQQQFLLFTCLLVCQLLLLRIQSLGRVV